MLEKNGKKIIVSADDFGISQKASEAVLTLAEKKILDRVEVMMSKNITLEQASKLLQSGAKMDIHLHLVKEKLDFWQNNPRKIETGALKRGIIFLYNVLFGKNQPKKAEKEWEKQIEDFKEVFGRYPDGLSSHEHIHFFPFYFRVAGRLCRKFNISYVRFGKKNFNGEKSQIGFIINIIKAMDRNTFKNFSLQSSDIMVSFDWIKNFNSFMEKIIPGDETEVVFHPEKENEFEFIEKLAK